MLYLKSFLAGLAAMIVVELIVITGGIAALVVIASRRPLGEEGGVGWEPPFICSRTCRMVDSHLCFHYRFLVAIPQTACALGNLINWDRLIAASRSECYPSQFSFTAP